MRLVLTLVSWLLTPAVLVPVCFCAVMILAGPDSSVLPNALGVAVLILGWACVLGVPIWTAHRIWRRFGSAGVR